MSRAHADAGFTLIEALVAMAVLALGAVSLLTATEGQTVRIGGVTDRTVARWAAEYRLTALRLELDAGDGRVETLGRNLMLRDVRAPLEGTGLSRVTVTASRVDAETALFTLTGYLGTGGTQ